MGALGSCGVSGASDSSGHSSSSGSSPKSPFNLAEQVVDLLIVIFYVKVIHARCSFLRSSEAPPSAKFIQNDTLLYQIFTVL